MELPVWRNNIRISSVILFIFILSCTGEADNLFSLAKEFWKRGEYTEAANTFQRFISCYPENHRLSEAYYNLGDIYYFYLEDNRAAIRYYRQVFKCDKNDEYIYDAQWKIARIYLEELKDYNQAIVEYKRFIEINHNELRDIEAQINIAESYTTLKYFSQAITEYEIILNDYPKNDYIDQIFYRLGNLYFLEERFNEAIKYYRKAIKKTAIKDIKLKSKYSLAESYHKMGELKTALSLYKQLYSTSDRYKSILKKKIEDIEKNFYVKNRKK
ncbi:MAG: tetratricopeptide repeat protein [bacterium]